MNRFSIKPIDICREYFPGEDDDFLGYLLWDHTGYPCFWDGDPEECLRTQLAIAKDTMDRCESLLNDIEKLERDQ